MVTQIECKISVNPMETILDAFNVQINKASELCLLQWLLHAFVTKTTTNKQIDTLKKLET